MEKFGKTQAVRRLFPNHSFMVFEFDTSDLRQKKVTGIIPKKAH